MRARCQSISPDRIYQCGAGTQIESPHDVHASLDAKHSWHDADVPLSGIDLPFPWARISFTATRKLRGEHESAVARALEDIVQRYRRMVAIVGGAVGGDAFIAKYLHEQHNHEAHVHTVLPAQHDWVDPNWEKNTDTYEQMPTDTTYRERDQRMVDLGDWTYGFPFHTRFEMGTHIGGTWTTLNYARHRDKTDRGSVFVLQPVMRFRDS
jgi:hypothetical protein